MHHLRFGSLFVALYNIIMNLIVTVADEDVEDIVWHCERKGTQKNRPIAREGAVQATGCSL